MNDPLPPEPPRLPSSANPPRESTPIPPASPTAPPPATPTASPPPAVSSVANEAPITPVALEQRLTPILARHRRLLYWRRLALGLAWAIAGSLLLAGLTRLLGFSSPLLAPALAVCGSLAALVFASVRSRASGDLRQAATDIESLHPELRGLLLTAVQQQPDVQGRLAFLQERVIEQAVRHGESHDWSLVVPNSRLRQAQGLAAFAAILFATLVWNLRVAAPPGQSSLVVRTSGVTITPGDVLVERGSSLVVLARFAGSVPAQANLVLTDVSNNVRSLPLTRSLEDPVFAVSIPEIPANLTYRVDYGTDRSRDFKVTVFEHPKLEKSDADLTFPSYTHEAPKRIENTRRVSAVEGTRVGLGLHLNKPVKSAQLLPRDASLGLPNVDLLPSGNQPAATLSNWIPALSATYDLRLVDTDGRTNKEPASFVVQVLPNRTPELKLTSPRGDIRPSAIEEVNFEGTVWDDFGTVAYGLAYTHGDGDTHFLELGREIPGKEKRPFHNLLRLEELGTKPDELLSWYLWADDIGPDGNVRRTASDMYFAEVRPFEEVFRESASQDQQQQQQEGQGQGSPTTRLAELQKQIVNATWKLERERTKTAADKLATDISVVRDSQDQALQQAQSAQEEDNDPRTAPLWSTVVDSMKAARGKLDAAAKSPDQLASALKSEQAAYQALLRLREREIQIARSRNRQQRGSGAGEEMRDRQFDQLDFADAENRYETQSQAQAPADPERREQLQVLNRLQELARRQQDINERLKELQTALREADTEQEREEIRRRLKRLQEEQQQMLADMDELQQRMNSAENQSRMAEQRRQLDQARNEMQRSTQATEQGAVPQALAAGTRAERQLEDVRDQVRKQSSSEFAEDLRQMRAEARELARRQEELRRDLADQPAPTRQPTLAPAEPKPDVAERLQAQKQRLTNLVNRATQVAQAADSSEPIVSRRLEETVRRLGQDEANSVSQLQNELIERGLMSNSLLNRLRNSIQQDPAKSMEATAEMLRQGLEPEAERAARRTQSNLENLQAGVSRAAETVLGDDLEALKQARARLDQLANQLEREIAQSTERSTNRSGAGATPGSPTQLAQNNAGRQPRTNSPSANLSRQGNTSPTGQSQGDTTEQGQQAGGDQPGGDQPGGDQPGGQQPGGQQPGGQQPGGQQPGGQQPGGQQPGGQQPGGQQPGGQQPGGQQPGGGQPRGGQAQRGQPGQRNSPQEGGENAQQQRGQQAGANQGLNRDANRDLGRFLGRGGPDGGGGDNPGPITGVDFAPWSDGLREVEEMVDLPELRNDVATARERARNLRLEWRKAGQKPDWAVVQGQVLGPLVEVRDRLAEEIARRDRGDQLVPIDRDPVPTRYSELVRRYYEELGKDR